MYYFIKTMYNQWVEGQSPLDVIHRNETFVKMAAAQFRKPEQEIQNYLNEQTWYIKSLDRK